jgi:hypothetical protein
LRINSPRPEGSRRRRKIDARARPARQRRRRPPQ